MSDATPPLPFTHGGLDRLHSWMHDSLDVLIAHLDTMPAPLLARKVDGFGYPTLLAQCLHILELEATWMARVHARKPRTWNPDEYVTLTSLVRAKREVVAETRADLAAFTAEALNETPAHVPRDWPGPPASPARILLHVITHACHHKGQMVAMCRILGHPAPDTDLQRA